MTRYAPEPNTSGALCGQLEAHVNTSQSGSHGPSSLALRAANALARLRQAAWPHATPQATSRATIATVAVAVLASVLPLMHEVLSHQSCSMLLSQPGAARQLSRVPQPAQAGRVSDSGTVKDLTRL